VTKTIYQTLGECNSGPLATIDSMIDYLRTHRRASELFEAKKMRVRAQLGLPLIVGETEPSRPEPIEQQLEAGVIEACREAGVMLMEDGKAAQGWMYLRPTGDIETARKLLAKIEITSDNYEEMLQVLLHEGVDIGRGFEAILKQQGTCNSITLYEQNLVHRPKSERREVARRLLAHLYKELCDAVRGDIARREAPASADESLHHMIQSRPWIMSEGGYHLDTTHIAATVQIASLVDTHEELQQAWELTQYGRKLHHQFQYPGEEPFVDFYPAYATLYSTLLGNDVEAGLRYFERKARTVNPMEHGTGAIETYIDLLERTGRHREAIDAATSLAPEGVPPQRIVPLLLEIAKTAFSKGDAAAFDPIAAYCQSRGDLLGYAATMASKSISASL
jgi:hypothetical protein